MHIDYDEIVKDFDIDGLSLRKVTNKFVEENFKDEISDLRLVMTMGNGDKEDNEVSEREGTFKLGIGEEVITDENLVNFMDLLMGQEMKTSIWLGFIQNALQGEFIKTVRTNSGIFLKNYNKEKGPTEDEALLAKIQDVPEKEIVNGIKNAIKAKIRNK